MKKIIALFVALAIALSMVVLMSPVVSAQELAQEIYSYRGDEEQYGVGEMEAVVRSYSTIQLEFPIEVADCYENFIYARNPNIEDGYRFEIRVTNLNDENALDFTNSAGEIAQARLISVERSDTDVALVRVTNDNPILVTFDYSNFNEANFGYASFFCELNEPMTKITPGEYRGVICYRIECNPYTPEEQANTETN